MKLKKLFLGAIVSLIFSINLNAQTVDEIIAKHLNALGGVENIKKLNTVVTKMNLTVQGIKVPIVTYQTHNEATKFTFSFGGKTGYAIITKTEGWNFDPIQQGHTKAEPMTPDDVKKSADDLDIHGALVDYKTKGYAVESLGSDDVDGTDCYKLKATSKEGKETTYYISKEDNMIIKQVSKSTINGKEIENPSTFSNYKKVNGVMMPFSLVGSFGPMEVEAYEVNVPINASEYKPAN